MPVNRRWPLRELLDACRSYAETTGYLILFEYALLPGINDREEDAERLIDLVRDIPCRINLIALNPVETGSLRPDTESAARFRAQLQAAGLFAIQRKALGQDIDGACGQLRGRFLGQM